MQKQYKFFVIAFENIIMNDKKFLWKTDRINKQNSLISSVY